MPPENLRFGSVAAAIAVALAIGGGAWFGSRTTTTETAAVSGGDSYTIVPETLVVHLSGPVNRPGLVVVSESARVADAIAGVGGAATGADLAGLDLASSVHDGDQIVAYPDLNGPFKTVEDLPDVGGIDEAKRAAMRHAIAVP